VELGGKGQREKKRGTPSETTQNDMWKLKTVQSERKGAVWAALERVGGRKSPTGYEQILQGYKLSWPERLAGD